MFLPGIYRIQNTINGNSYIGSAVVVQKRWNVHNHDLKKNKHHSPHLQRAYNKYGVDAFNWYVLELVRDENKLIEREQHYIDELNPEYNICKIAGSRLGMKHTDEAKKKIIEARIGRKRTKESRLKQSRSIAAAGGSHFKGKTHSKETRRKLSEAHKGKNLGEENPFYGKTHTDEFKEKMREFRTGNKASDETKAKMSAMRKGEGNSMFGKTHKSESIKKMSVPVTQYTKDSIFVKEWMSATEAAKSLEKSSGNITSCARGKLPTAYGFIWKYKELNTNTNIN